MLYEFDFLSSNERDKVQAWFYVPATEPVGIVQLVHGFGEHSRRYLHMISSFLDDGFIVACDDHIGHGKTAVVNDSWGHWGNKGVAMMVEDEKTLHDLAVKEFPDLPYFFFGHSMGSVITRQFISRYGDLLNGAILCGTCGSDLDLATPKAIYEKEIAEGRALETSEEALTAFFGGLFDRLDEVKYGNEWICHDPWVQADHAKDPMNAFTKPTDNESMLTFIEMIEEVTSDAWYEKVPADLPIYLIAGDQDPFGSYGSGAYETANKLIAAGHTDVTTLLYSGLRHEIHNYKEYMDEVECGVLDFMDEHLE